MENKGWKFGAGEYDLPPEYPVDKFVDVLEEGLKSLQISFTLYPANSPGSVIIMAHRMTEAAVEAHDALGRALMSRPADMEPEAETRLLAHLNYSASLARLRLKEAMIVCARAIVGMDEILGELGNDLPTP